MRIHSSNEKEPSLVFVKRHTNHKIKRFLNDFLVFSSRSCMKFPIINKNHHVFNAKPKSPLPFLAYAFKAKQKKKKQRKEQQQQSKRIAFSFFLFLTRTKMVWRSCYVIIYYIACVSFLSLFVFFLLLFDCVVFMLLALVKQKQ